MRCLDSLWARVCARDPPLLVRRFQHTSLLEIKACTFTRRLLIPPGQRPRDANANELHMEVKKVSTPPAKQVPLQAPRLTNREDRQHNQAAYPPWHGTHLIVISRLRCFLGWVRTSIPQNAHVPACCTFIPTLTSVLKPSHVLVLLICDI